MHRNDRAVSAVVGIALLFGMVAVVSIGLLVMAGASSESLQHESANERAEQAFTELGSEMAATVADGDAASGVNLDVGDTGAIAQADTGSIVVESDGLETPLNETFGTIEYTGEDGTTIAYEAGAVFRETGNETRVVQHPPAHYDVTSETLTLPIVDIADGGDLSSGDLTLEHRESTPHAEATVVEDEHVDVTIQSDYYLGWKEHFQGQAGDTSVRAVDHENDTIEVRLGHLEIDEAIERSMVLADGFGDAGNPGIEDEEYVIATMPEIDAVIEDMFADAEAGTFAEDVTEVGVLDGTGPDLEAGVYYADAVHLTENLAADLTDGNVTLLVDGNVTVDEQLAVTNWTDDSALKLYTNGHVDVDTGEICVEPCGEDTASSPMQIFASSDSHVSIGTGESAFEGLLYAASNDDFEGPNVVHEEGQCDAQVCMHSRIDFFGAVIGNSVDVQGGQGSIDFAYDESLADANVELHPEQYTLPPQLTYLNVAHHEVDVRDG